MAMLKIYGQLLGYNLNITKTQVLTINYSLSSVIRQRYKYKWDPKKDNIPNSYFNAWDKRMCRYIWTGAKPGRKYQTFQINKEHGGLVLLILKQSYYAAHLAQSRRRPRFSTQFGF